MSTKSTPTVGQTVTVKPTGRQRKFRLTVTQIEMIDSEAFLIGYIPSAKSPGDFIGRGSAWASEVVE
jgi:hypothetical protein